MVASMALFLVIVASLCVAGAAGAGVQLVFDDMASNVSKSSQMSYEGSYEPCMRDAHAGQFHHDWARNKGQAFFEYKFQVPETGCYSLEEYHPGGEGNSECSRYLPSNARLDVDWCMGRSSTLFVDQSKNGARWNFLGVFPFYEGWEGSLKMVNSPGETCAVNSCFWVVDAFRLTRVADGCSSELEMKMRSPQEAEALQSAQAPQEAVQEAQEAQGETEEAQTSKWQVGSLRLSLEASPDAGLTTSDELLGSLSVHMGVIEATLKTQLGAAALKIEKIEAHSAARRCSVCTRRLLATGTSFEVTFRAQSPDSDSAPEELAAELSAALAAAGSSLKVPAADVVWLDSELGMSDFDESPLVDSTTLVLLAVLGGLAMMLLFCASVVALRKCQSSRAVQCKDVDLEAAPAPKKEEKDENEAKEDALDDNASTISPGSDHSDRS